MYKFYKKFITIQKRFKQIFAWIWKKKRRTIPSMAVIIAAGLFFVIKHSHKSTGDNFVSLEYTVDVGEIVNSLNLMGTTQFANAQKLSFINKGRVTSVKVKVGDSVKKGDILATITTDDLDKEIETAKKNVKNHQLKLDKLKKESNKELAILKAQSKYDELVLQKLTLPTEQEISRQSKELEIIDLKKQIEQKDAEFKTAKKLLELSSGQNSSDILVSQEIMERDRAMLELIHGIRNISNELDSLLENYNKNIFMGGNIGYLGDTKDIAIRKYEYVDKKIKELKDSYRSLSSIDIKNITEYQILSGYSPLKDISETIKIRGEINISAFEEYIEYHEIMKEEMKELIKTYGDGYIDKSFSLMNTYLATIDKINGIKNGSSSGSILQKTEQLKIDVENLRLSLFKKEQELQNIDQINALATAEMDKSILDAKNELEKAKAGELEQEEIEMIKNEINDAQFTLDTLMKRYDEYKIVANFDGIVTKVNMQVGDSIGINSSSSENEMKYIYVETSNLLEIMLELDQIDIIKVEIGMPVQVYLDAFPGVAYTGTFSEIDTMPEGSIYRAKVIFQKNDESEKILGGMSANVNVVLDEIKDIVVVPNTAIAENENGEKIVRLQKGNDTRIDQVVEIGTANDFQTQIISGLEVGDIIKELYINESSLNAAGIGNEEDYYEGGMMY